MHECVCAAWDVLGHCLAWLHGTDVGKASLFELYAKKSSASPEVQDVARRVGDLGHDTGKLCRTNPYARSMVMIQAKATTQHWRSERAKLVEKP